MSNFVQTIKVIRSLPVAGTNGFELQGTMGSSRVAWKEGILYAESLPNLKANPPIPILSSKAKEASSEWKGRVYAAGKTYEATATIEQNPEELQQKSRKLKTIKTVVSLILPESEIIITTWYAHNVGPISQDQVTKYGSEERFNTGLEYVSGP